jgi:hypothetical protein
MYKFEIPCRHAEKDGALLTGQRARIRTSRVRIKACFMLRLMRCMVSDKMSPWSNLFI